MDIKAQNTGHKLQTKHKLQSTEHKSVWNLGFVFWVLFGFWILGFGFSFANAQSVYEGTNVPYIHPRSEWLSTPELQNLFSWYPYAPKPDGEIPDYYPINRIVIHDTGCNPAHPGCNDESIDTQTLIQNIFRFHAITRGWGDIGYHYVIDRKGEIWEGRYGGNTVRGAHLFKRETCQNFNVGTAGIVLIGNYYDTQIPPAMTESLKRLVAWLSALNNIDPTAITTVPVWTNPRDANGKCVAEGGGFTSTYTGSTVLTHRDIVPTNSDIKNIDLVSLRNGSTVLVQDIKSYAFKEQGSDNLYDIVQTKLQSLSSTTKKIVSVLKSQLDIFRPELFAKKPEPTAIATPQFPDGTLVRAKGQEDVYLIKNQKRVHISSAAIFEGLTLKWEDIKETDEATLNSLAMADPIVFPDEILLQAETPDVYYVKNSKRYLISSAQLFGAYNFKWEDIVHINLKELDRYYPWGGYVKWPEGSILQNVFDKNQTLIVHNDTIEPLTKKLPKEKPINMVNGRELASYQSAQVLTPGSALALSQAFDAVKQKLGVGAVTTVHASQNITGSDSPTTPTTLPAPPTQPQTPSAQAGAGTVPAIKIALCKTRNTPSDLGGCAFSLQDKLEIIPHNDGTVTVNGHEDRPAFNTSLNDNAFRGKVYTTQTSDGNVWLINELPLEDYLKGIAETLGTDTPEYRKTLITIARSYAYYYLTQEKKYPGMPFDLVNLSFSQVYRGYNYELRSNGLPAVVDASRGQIVTFNGKPIVGAYSSDSGGVSKNPCPTIFPKYCDATGTIKPEFTYLKGGVADPPNTTHNQAKVAASHGVGMCAVGARTMVDNGKSFGDVIKYYYPGVDIQKLY